MSAKGNNRGPEVRWGSSARPIFLFERYCRCLDKSTQGEYTKSKAAMKNLKVFND